MTKGLCYFAIKTLDHFHADRPFSDWAQAFQGERIANLSVEFESALAVSSSWQQGWAAFHQFRKKLGEIRNEYDQQRSADETRRFMAELQEQCSLFSETPVCILPKHSSNYQQYRARVT